MAVDRGVVLSGPGAIALEEIRVEAPGPGEVLVGIEATGVCHSDLHVIEEDGWGHSFPILLGHEGAGTVESIGDGVDGLSPGDRVVLGWKTACGTCPTSRESSPARSSSALWRSLVTWEVAPELTIHLEVPDAGSKR